jgi:glycerophosphoryl diester phosphodiesterase
MTDPSTGSGRILVLGHRGDPRRAPENTVEALLAALAVPGCDGVEFDVRAARGGTPVLAHDPTLRRVHDRRDRVDALSTAALAAAGVPTLREALETLPRRAFVDVELKEDVGAAVVPVLRAARGPDLANGVISSFDEATLRTVRRLAPGWPTWLGAVRLDETAVRTAVAIGCRGIAAGHRSIDAGSIERARDAGLVVAAWTVRRASTLDRLARLGTIAACVEGAALDAVDRSARAASTRAPAGTAGRPAEEE